jgi:anti-sigma factor RsiW
MRVTRDVVLDLLPIYLAGEASSDTRALVESYLETDPELADIAQQQASVGMPKDIPVPLGREDQMEAYKQAQRMLWIRTLIVAVSIAALLGLAGIALLAAIRLLG